MSKGTINPMFKKLSLWRAIRNKCLDCCCGSQAEVAVCNRTSCALWAYRFGASSPKKAISRVHKQKTQENP